MIAVSLAAKHLPCIETLVTMSAREEDSYNSCLKGFNTWCNSLLLCLPDQMMKKKASAAVTWTRVQRFCCFLL